jgi:hypothetical protein
MFKQSDVALEAGLTGAFQQPVPLVLLHEFCV